MDSVTRLAMAQREIGLAVGEPPTTKGYTPSVVFRIAPSCSNAQGQAEKARRARSPRSSPCWSMATITMNRSRDAVRGILDGHIVMERAIAERGRYPAINI
ncbi:MAG: hypothetical protein WDM79_01480 [Terricaulis sp.]